MKRLRSFCGVAGGLVQGLLVLRDLRLEVLDLRVELRARRGELLDRGPRSVESVRMIRFCFSLSRITRLLRRCAFSFETAENEPYIPKF